MSTFKVSRYSGSKITFSKKVISTSFSGFGSRSFICDLSAGSMP